MLIKMGLPKGTGTFLMELKLPAVVSRRISTEPEVRWWYVWITDEVERMGSTAVRYLILTRKYPLECTQHTGVSDIVHFCSVQLYCSAYMCSRRVGVTLPHSTYSQQAWIFLVCFVQSVWLSWSHVHSKIGLTTISAADREGERVGGANRSSLP